MDPTIIDWLNQYNVKVGSIVIVIGIIVLIVSTIYKGRQRYDKLLEDMVQRRIKKEEEDKEEEEQVAHICNTLNKLSDDIEKLSVRIDDIDKRLSNSEDFVSNTDRMINCIQRELNVQKRNTELLIDSDKENIKSLLLSHYYRWTKAGKIDLYTLNTLEEKFKKYKKENGNTFVEDLMKQMRSLPKVVNLVHENEVDPIGYFRNHPEVLEEMGIDLLEINKKNEE
jgi:septal ring factor EnvC (AmiA/AmiB activator)